MRFENIKNAIEREEARQKVAIDLIPSENVASADVKEALGSCLTNKYTEGYPAVRELGGNTGRYYGGCVNYDYVEEQCCLAWAKVFNTNYHVNVQPHSGSNANMAAFMAVLEPGDTILSMCLSNGGHLTHGSPVNFSGKQYRFVFYDVDENGFIDMDCVERIAEQFKPKLIQPYHRLPQVRGHRGAQQRVFHGRHGAHRRTHRSGRASLAVRSRGYHHDDHA